MNRIITVFIILSALVMMGFTETHKEKTNSPSSEEVWVVDFFDDFDTFDTNNWQDQRMWVNNEKQCYVPDGKYGTREVSDGTLKLRLINIGEEIKCDNFDKHGNQQANTQ